MAVMRQLRGFTLIEVVVVMAVFAILLAIAVPSMSQFVTENRIKQAATDINMTLLNARSNAMRMGVPVVVCASTGVASGGVASCDASSWSSGWVSFVDFQRTGSPTASGVLVVHGAIPSSLYVTVTPSSTTALQYLPGGQLRLQATGTGGSAATTATKIAICDVTGKSSTMAQQVNILSNGRPQQLNLGTCP
ncbi:type IV fimbrial biogenesis protein FimT [Aquitalea magnusonii]|jgi:type IV fimbrial biogenesis protein FimT|uniref:Type II secretion system protein H n=1 Tax=Aquitalea magnusonii TaxID=332411 RepID=A0A3G9GIQ7_9NEIS|nr:GspH/FimT family pseudopilin [Aquitalea magnusonii]BBF87405.1 type IV fimbrial biogenesis protein FimT [Aquitalea magnusonii]